MKEMIEKIRAAVRAVRRHWAAALGTATLCGCMFWVGYEARAGAFAFGNMTLVNNTTSNLVTTAITTVTLPRPTIYYSHSGLAATNDVLHELQFAIGSAANFVTVYSWYSATTNDTSTSPETFSPLTTNITLYIRGRATTTNATSVGGSGFY